jgi:anti-anti-sigma factor
MPPIRRRSRADKRRRNASIPHEDHRNYVAPDLKIKTEVKDNNLLIWIHNALVSTNCFPLRDVIYQKLAETSLTRVIINMSEVSYADTTGLSILIDIQRCLNKDNLSFVLYRITPRIKEILEMLNLYDLFDIRDH